MPDDVEKKPDEVRTGKSQIPEFMLYEKIRRSQGSNPTGGQILEEIKTEFDLKNPNRTK
jgi:hypothetical protein